MFWSEKGRLVILNNDWKGVQIDNQFALYNISKDVSETTDLKGEHPDIASNMEKELKEWLKEIQN